MHPLANFGRIGAFQKSLDSFPQVRKRRFFGVPFGHHSQLDALGDEAAIFRPDSCVQLHIP